jgi:hypothetical protein
LLLEKFPVHDGMARGEAVAAMPVRDPVDLAVERLVGMGFEEDRVKKALAKTDTGSGVSFDRALAALVKERERRRRLERIERMG